MNGKKLSFSIPVLDEPFKKDFTYQIYEQARYDFVNDKPVPSHIVTGIECGTTCSYIDNEVDALNEVASRIEVRLNNQIKYHRDILKRLEKAKELFDAGGPMEFVI